jgi:aryl-alcohol dehydrogenase-like predicted oxidoreductase
MVQRLTRRRFVRDTAAAATALAAGTGAPSAAHAAEPDPAAILNHNPDMEYRRCGKTGLMVSAVALGGHWKRVVTVIGGKEPSGWMTTDIKRKDFQLNRNEVVTRCIQRGINYIDACCGEEILAYSRALEGRRDRMYLGYSWHAKESRYEKWRSLKKLQRGLDDGMKKAGLDYVDVWRITLLVDSSQHSPAELESVFAALDWAKQTGRARFVGVSSHEREHLRELVETYGDALDVVLTPYTAGTRSVQDETGLWAAIRKHDLGWFGIKPFASNSVFLGDSSPDSAHFEEDNRIARLALRYILCNPAITAPIPGLISVQQVDNAALAVKERRELDVAEADELARAMDRAWAELPPGYHWLKDWETV